MIPSFSPDILEEHVDEIAFLWEQRRNALRAPHYTMRELGALEDRIDAHLGGIRAIGEKGLPILEERLASDDHAVVFAAAFGMLRLEVPAALKRVLDAFTTAEGDRLEGLREAMCHGPVATILSDLHARFLSAPPPNAIAAGEVLVFHSDFRPTSEQLSSLLRDERPEVKRCAWRLLGHLGEAADAKDYASAMRDEDAGVRGAAAVAAAWARVPGILNFARQLAGNPSEDHLPLYRLLATLGVPGDRPRIEALVGAETLGPLRFSLAGAYGHPALVEPLLLPAMEHDDPERAAAAALAYTKITGIDLGTDKRATVPPKDGDAVDAEFADDVPLPDVAKARTHWSAVRDRVGQAVRLRRGTDIAGGTPPELFAGLDMESRWEIWLRSRFDGSWSGSPISLEVFPQRA